MKYLLSVFFFVLGNCLVAQDVSFMLQKQPSMDKAEKAAQWQSMKSPVEASFVNSNVRYSQDRVPQIVPQNRDTLMAWKGEKIHTQLAIWSNKSVSSVSMVVNDLTSKSGQVISKKNVTTGFVGYVITDEFGGGCGYRKSQDFDSSLVADPINTSSPSVEIKRNTVQPVWVSVQVPANTPAGVYNGIIEIKADNSYSLKLTVFVLDKTLPPPSEWSFNLDLWQHPAAIARVHTVPLWSDEHFALMKKYYVMLANAGQKNITASIVNEPWGHQTYDDFPSLIKWTKKKNSTWYYDYSLFDKYISFVMSCGIDKRINCYSMVPWKIAFQYYDEETGKDTVFTSAIGTTKYNEFWKRMLTDFTKHLKEKGWFSITAIAMDERPLPAMQSVIKLLKEIDPEWKVALAGNYHPEIENDVYDYCIASRFEFPADTLQLRKQQGKLSTWYTCCTEKYPNGFTFSPPAENSWIGWHTAAKIMDGYLRWAYNSWPKDPLHDSRFTAWPAGDTYQVYPGPMTSIRFEKLIEGVQDFEKIHVLKALYTKQGNQKKLAELEEVLNNFRIKNLETETAEAMVVDGERLLNE
ncbi:MAG: glycoside hydrolase domain-containing protein [Ginsengibacter sp.]